MADELIADRNSAGRDLAAALQHYAGRDDVIVLALPRGGVPVGYEIAKAIGAPLDLMLVRKLGTPGQPELAMGAIATGGARVMNQDIVSALGIPQTSVDAVALREQAELLRRERIYRGLHAPPPSVRARTVILVDDGVATGATIRVAIAALRQQDPARLVVAVPVAPPETVGVLEREADEVVCLKMPEPFIAIGRWYRDFPQLEDDQVRDWMSRARQ
ncbi:MAG: phosphoribosyltransferase [Thiohalocapsa sp.]|nr:phosphoribosyltransferase [Thiohalocapsa sp.]